MIDRLASATLVGVATAVFCVTFVSSSAVAASIAEDGFDYSAGTIVGQDTGTGDWKDEWQGDADIIVFPGGYAYVDALGNVLLVEGSHVEVQAGVGSVKKVDRPLNINLGEVEETVWMSAILVGSSTDSINNVSLGDGLFLGQGGENTGSTTWQLSDRDDQVYDTGVSADSQEFIVVRVDFTDGDEQAWMWLDPELGFTPDIANADASGSIKSFEADFLQIQLEISGSAGVDEIRLGETFADIAPYTPAVPIPEPDTAQLVSLGLLGLSICVRRRSASRR
jgi:hypothetical protein